MVYNWNIIVWVMISSTINYLLCTIAKSSEIYFVQLSLSASRKQAHTSHQTWLNPMIWIIRFVFMLNCCPIKNKTNKRAHTKNKHYFFHQKLNHNLVKTCWNKLLSNLLHIIYNLLIRVMSIGPCEVRALLVRHCRRAALQT